MKEFLITLLIVIYYSWAFMFLFCRWWGNPWTGKPGKYMGKTRPDPSEPIGRITKIHEDDRGIYYEGYFYE